MTPKNELLFCGLGGSGEIGRPVKVVATGGLATLFEKQTDVFDVIEADLTIQGLAMMWARHHIKGH